MLLTNRNDRQITNEQEGRVGELPHHIEIDTALPAGHGLSPSSLIEANINPDTLLATDYLNHYNEVIMLFEMLPDMPDCLEDVEAWAPKSYEDHFSDSSFQGKELAIAAYRHAALPVRTKFENICAELDIRILETAHNTRTAWDAQQTERFREICQDAQSSLSPLLDQLNGAIHGSMDDGNSETEAEIIPDLGQTQADIDALFD